MNCLKFEQTFDIQGIIIIPGNYNNDSSDNDNNVNDRMSSYVFGGSKVRQKIFHKY